MAYMLPEVKRHEGFWPTPTPFQVPQPYALAISSLGRIKISGLQKQLFLTPVPPADAADTTFGCPDEGHIWNPVAYSRAVEFAKKLGLHFSSVDLTLKMGSSWWLFRPVYAHGHFRLDCPYPQENFTNTTAAVAMLYCNDGTDGLYNPIIDLPALGADTFGSMLRDPPADIAVSAFYAVIDSNEQ
nr:putative coat protein [Ipomoea batatas]